jgi:hypothetical protein
MRQQIRRELHAIFSNPAGGVLPFEIEFLIFELAGLVKIGDKFSVFVINFPRLISNERGPKNLGP